MPRKGENIYKRKDGRWEGRYIRSYDSEHKAKYAYVYGKTYSEVKRKLTEQRGNVQKVQPTKNKSSTYGELLDCWLHSMQLNTKESTQARYTHLIKTHIKPHLGAVQLSQLTTDVIEIFIEQQLTDGRLDNSGGLSPKTVTDILTIIKSTIEYARYKELPVICNLSKLSIKKKEKEMRVFTPSEQESLIGTLTNDMDHSKFGVLLSLYTGIRVGELCALQWEDFDLAHSKLKIRKTMQRIQDLGNGSVSKTKIVITEPKSQCSIREIPLPLFIVDVAKKFASNPKAYILTGTDQYIEPRTMQNRFKSYVKECNVEPANFHVLRHTFATRCVEVGFEVKSLSEVLGHANVNITLGFNNSTSTGYSSGSSWASAVTRGTSETKGETVTETDTDTTGDSRTITVTSENKSVKYILEKIDQHLARIKNCEAFGLWDIACYFVSENVQTSVVAASTYKALMAGFDSGVENSYVNVWKQDNTENTPALLEYLRYCIHPRFSIPGDDQFFEVESQTVNPCSLISGNEMPYIMGLPHHSVPGVTVLNMAEFGRNVRFSSGAPRGKKVELGQVYHMGEKETARVKLDLESFRSHCFITGSTGSGKSNTTYRILDEMIEHKIPFLVVEPAKGEYKRYYGKLPGIHVYCTNPRYYSMLHINPFRFNQGIHVLEHLDRLIEIFNACWPLYAAMPAILKESFERAYIKCGWDLENSIYIPNGHSKFPTFNDVLEALPEIINSSSYSSDSKGDYTGALVTRVKSLTNGISGQVLCSVNDIDEEYLFDQNTIVDLSRVSSLETKSLLMGVLILKLNEYRMCTSEENQPLRHVTVMEEAHNILKRSPTGGSEGSNVQAKSVEMISSAIAEMRTYGEGFIIVDQSPTAVDVSAVKNTNTKIIMRLPDYEDCKIAGLSMGLNDSQIREISRFPMGVAVVYQNNWVEAVLTQIDKSEEQYHQTDLITDDYALAVIKGQLAVELIFQYETGLAADEGFQLDDLLEVINNSDINASKKQDIVQSMVDWCSCFEREAPVNGTFAAKLAEFISCNGLFEALPIRFAKDYKNEPKITRDCIDKKDLASIRNWHSRVYDHLDSYVLLTDENIKNRVLRYLLLNKRVEEINYNKYQLIYEGIYGKARGNK